MSAPLVPLGKVALSMRNGLSPARGGTVEGEVLTLSAVTRGRFRPEERKPATFDVQPSPEQKTRPGMFLMCRGNGNLHLVGAGVAVPPGVAESVFPDTVIGAVLNEAVVDSRYLAHAWATETVRSQIEAGARTTNGTYKVNQQVLEAIRVPLPPLPEQRRIAALLDEADALRRKRREALALLDDLLRATFLDMFGDPVTNPKAWPMLAIREIVVSIEAGWSSPSLDHAAGPGEWGVLKVSAVSTGRFLEEENKAVEEPDFQKPPVVPRRGDLLFSRANTRELVAATCLVEHDAPRRFLPDKLWRVACHPDVALVEWLRFLLGHEDYRASLAKHATGTSGSMLNVSQEKFLSMLAPLPPIDRQRAFGQVVWQVLAERRRSVLAMANAEALFSSLLDRAFTGGI